MKFSATIFWLCFCSVVLVNSQIAEVHGQDSQGLPANWEQLPETDFAHQTITLFKENKLTGTDERLVALHAKEILLATDIQKVGTDKFQMLDELFEMSRAYLEPADIEQMVAAISARTDDWTGRPYVEIRSKVAFMEWLKISPEECFKDAIAWFDAGGEMAEVWDEDLSVIPYYLNRDAQVLANGFTTEWEGRIQIPTSGSYIFSISPFDVNGSSNRYHLKQTMTVTINGNKVISATPEKWTSSSTPIELTGSEYASLKVEWDVETKETLPNHLHATLFWEGPGIEKVVIPDWQLKLPSTDERGLRATYSWQENDAEQQFVQIDSNIDFNWPTGKVVLSSNATEDWGIWFKSMKASYLDALESNGELHPFLVDPDRSAESLTSEQREKFLSELLSRPQLLKNLGVGEAAAFYRSFRIGAPDKALDVFGVWATQHADYECHFPIEVQFAVIDLHNREALRNLAVNMGYELPGEITRLRTEYLELNDGTCSLPIAYILGYFHLSQGRLSEWSEFLDSKLNSSTLTGDQRINWLIAKAHSKEIRLASRAIRVNLNERAMDGLDWIEEAVLVAQSPETKVRVVKERAARLTSGQKFEEARTIIEQAGGTVPASFSEKLATCTQCVNSFETLVQNMKQDQASKRKTAHLDRLKKRRDKAQNNGNGAAVERYNQLIQEVEASN